MLTELRCITLREMPSAQKSVAIQYYLILLLALFLTSCNNKTQPYLLQQNFIRIQQQNEIIKNDNQSLRYAMDQPIQKYRYSQQDDSLKTFIEDLYKKADLFFNKITEIKKTGVVADTVNLYKYYHDFQSGFQQIKSVMNYDDVGRNRTNLNGFMNLDEKNFALKYCKSSDSFAIQNQLLLLETDALINYNQCLRNICTFITIPYCGITH